MSADRETPVIDWLQGAFEDVEFDIDPADLALYGSFVFVGIGIGAIFTVALITQAIGPEHLQSGPFVDENTLQISPELIFGARDKVLIGAGAGFLACNGYVLYTVLAREEGKVSNA